MIVPGQLNRVIRIESLEQQQDPTSGEITNIWLPFVDQVPAGIAPLSGREFIASQATQAQVDTMITLWYLPGILARMRAIDIAEGTIYNINAVLPDNVNGYTWLTLVCQSGVTDGS